METRIFITKKTPTDDEFQNNEKQILLEDIQLK
jgi:hypothetical protein